MAPSLNLSGAFALVMSMLVLRSTAQSSCIDPQGVQWALYPNPFGDDPTKPPTYPKFNPTYIKTQDPEYDGVTGSIGLEYTGNGDYFYAYGDYDDYVYGQDWIIDHRGYIHAPVTGFYNFTIINADDIVEFWHGKKAYTGWTRHNSDLTYSNSEQPPPPVSYTFRLVKGTYTPFRIVWGQAAGPWKLYASLSGPSGTEILGSSSTYNHYVVQYSCKNPKAPPFPPYGSE